MITAAAITAMMRKHHVTIAELAEGCDLTQAQIHRWRGGIDPPPHYIEWTIRAIEAKSKPATLVEMVAADLNVLCIVPERIAFWNKTMQFPRSARLAIAWRNYSKLNKAANTLQGHDHKVLDQVNRSRYFRVRNGWRCRPVNGRPVSNMRLRTPDKLIRLGYLVVSYEGRAPELRLTDKGRKELYKS